MSEPRLDTVARLLARGLSRRRVAGGLGGSAVAVAGLLVLPGVVRGCQKAGETCDRNSTCCAGAACVNGVCRCGAGRRDCDGTGRCVDHASNVDHCGRCGNSCAGRGLRAACCAGECVDVDRDPANCGACGATCGAGELCVRGACLACPLGATPCGSVCCRAPGICRDGQCVGDDPAGENQD